MNALFVNVKVDREERPDVDAIYMDAVQAFTGRGGWPMTVFMTPAGEPFFGGTYFPLPQFRQLMERVDEAWRTQRDGLVAQADKVVEALRRFDEMAPADDLPDRSLVGEAAGQLVASLDGRWGGFGRAPKFPQTMNLELLLRRHRRDGDEAAGAAALGTLHAMGQGGIHDHLGGGFARYSVDDRWLAPTSRRCCTTRPCCCAPTSTAGRCRDTTTCGRRRRASWRTSSVISPTPTGASSPPRTPTPRASRAGSTSGRPSRWPRCSGPRRPVRCASGTTSPRRATSRERRSPTGSTVTGWPGRPRSRRPGGGWPRPAPGESDPASTTRSSPSGTGSCCRR